MELSGFENENTDIIKKQPTRTSPTKTKEEAAADSVEAQLEALKITMEMGNGGEYDNSMMFTSGGNAKDSLGEGKNVYFVNRE